MPDKPPPDWGAIEQKAWRDSRDEVCIESRNQTSRLRKSAATFADKFGYALNCVLEKIGADPMFAAAFCKNPTRTSLHESTATNWIEELPEVENFKRLPNNGPKSLKINGDGNLVQGAKKNIPGKSLDFCWTSGVITYYAMHKYTTEPGGTQDSQFKEMKDLMIRFGRNEDTNIGLIIIVDGDYYQRKNREKLRELLTKEKEKPPICTALSIQELPSYLRDKIKTVKP